MSDSTDTDLCDFCKVGRLVTRDEEIAFHQLTNRGYIYCRVTVPMGICDRCEAKTLGEAAEAIIDEAVRRELEKLR